MTVVDMGRGSVELATAMTASLEKTASVALTLGVTLQMTNADGTVKPVVTVASASVDSVSVKTRSLGISVSAAERPSVVHMGIRSVSTERQHADVIVAGHWTVMAVVNAQQNRTNVKIPLKRTFATIMASVSAISANAKATMRVHSVNIVRMKHLKTNRAGPVKNWSHVHL